VLAILATVAAVAGGQLAVSMQPARPQVGHRIDIAMTGQVGDKGRLYVYRNRSARCSATAAGERRIGVRIASWRITQPFEHHVRFTPRQVRTEWVCAYLYAITCDAAGHNCAPAVGLPPDAGFAQVRVKVRPASHSVKSAAGSGRVIT
jgi:hypothetical protein